MDRGGAAFVAACRNTYAYFAPRRDGAARIGAYVNSVVLNAVPAAKEVTTFDADNKILEMTSRK